WSANKQLALPDLCGRPIGGRDDMGNGPQNRITQGNLGVDPTVVGAAGGEEKHTLTSNEIPAHNHAISITDPGHAHSLNNATGVYRNVAGAGGVSGGGGNVSDITVQSAQTGISASAANTGGGNAHNNLPPVALFTIYIRL